MNSGLLFWSVAVSDMQRLPCQLLGTAWLSGWRRQEKKKEKRRHLSISVGAERACHGKTPCVDCGEGRKNTETKHRTLGGKGAVSLYFRLTASD